jgi:hypothetical protein
MPKFAEASNEQAKKEQQGFERHCALDGTLLMEVAGFLR